MGRTAKAWWWEERGAYFATVRGTRHRLAETKKQADDLLKILVKSPPERRVDSESLAVLLDAFLEWTLENRSPRTYRGYKDFCQAFRNRWPNLKVNELKPLHVTEWLSGQSTWNSTTRRGAITCLQRALNWAEKNWDLQKNPLRRMEKPEAQRRDRVVSADEFRRLLKEIKDDRFKELLIVSNETGSRPQEIKRLEARHVDLKSQYWFIPKDEAKGRRRPRIVYMTPKALTIVKLLVKEHPQGPLFLNARGRQWTASAVKCRFDRLEAKVGIRYCQYLFRHSWVTRKIVAGVDSHVVAALAGHADSAMIDKVYSKVAANHQFMLDAARR